MAKAASSFISFFLALIFGGAVIMLGATELHRKYSSEAPEAQSSRPDGSSFVEMLRGGGDPLSSFNSRRAESESKEELTREDRRNLQDLLDRVVK